MADLLASLAELEAAAQAKAKKASAKLEQEYYDIVVRAAHDVCEPTDHKRLVVIIKELGLKTTDVSQLIETTKEVVRLIEIYDQRESRLEIMTRVKAEREAMLKRHREEADAMRRVVGDADQKWSEANESINSLLQIYRHYPLLFNGKDTEIRVVSGVKPKAKPKPVATPLPEVTINGEPLVFPPAVVVENQEKQEDQLPSSLPLGPPAPEAEAPVVSRPADLVTQVRDVVLDNDFNMAQQYYDACKAQGVKPDPVEMEQLLELDEAREQAREQANIDKASIDKANTEVDEEIAKQMAYADQGFPIIEQEDGTFVLQDPVPTYSAPLSKEERAKILAAAGPLAKKNKK